MGEPITTIVRATESKLYGVIDPVVEEAVTAKVGGVDDLLLVMPKPKEER